MQSPSAESKHDPVAGALTLLGVDEYFFVTIDLIEGGQVRTDAVIVRPTDAAAQADLSLASSEPPQPALAFRWLETLDPLYAGHPGSVFPVSSAVALTDGRVEVRGSLGVATLRAATAKEAAQFGGWADATGDGMNPEERPLGLPLNRKERFYTGTVLPAIVAGERLADLERLLALCGLDDVDVTDLADVQFFTEYSFAESVFNETDRRRFARRPSNADTPDIVVRGPGWLLAIEAKMFHRPSVASLNEQYARQSVLVDYWAVRLGAHPDRVRHVMLLPRSLASASYGGVHAPVITWEEILDAYASTGTTHWTGVLREALDRYSELASKDSTWGLNAQQRLTGLQILAAWKSSDPAVAWIGRAGGVNGSQFVDDVKTGSWRTHAYEIRDASPDGLALNWFPVHAFVNSISEPHSAS